VLLLNADCVLRPGFLAAALSHLTDPGIGSAALKLIRAQRRLGDDPAAPSQLDAAGMVVESPAQERAGRSWTVGGRSRTRRAGLRRRRCRGAVPPRDARGVSPGEREVLDEDMAL